MEPDPYGIPERFFGPLSPELPALIGRVVMLSTLLETKVWAFACSIANEPQSEYAATNVSENITLSKKRLEHYQMNVKERTFALKADELLDDINTALSARNEIIHRVWPKSGLDEWAGWKHIRKNNRVSLDEISGEVKWTNWSSYSRHDLIALISKMIQLIDHATELVAEVGSIPRRDNLL